MMAEKNASSLHWKLGRITQTYPDKKGALRSVNVRNLKTEFRRNVHQLVPLKTEEEILNRQNEIQAGKKRKTRNSNKWNVSTIITTLLFLFTFFLRGFAALDIFDIWKTAKCEQTISLSISRLE